MEPITVAAIIGAIGSLASGIGGAVGSGQDKKAALAQIEVNRWNTVQAVHLAHAQTVQARITYQQAMALQQAELVLNKRKQKIILTMIFVGALTALTALIIIRRTKK